MIIVSCYPTHDILPARNGSTNASHDTPNCNNFSSAFIHDFSLMQSEHQEAEKASFSLAPLSQLFSREKEVILMNGKDEDGEHQTNAVVLQGDQA